MVDEEKKKKKKGNPAYRLAKKLQKKYGEKYDITVTGLYSKDGALMRIKKRDGHPEPEEEEE